ncbi:tetratricopeptide repeat protein [Striga asiatica]|uniref:Tetratricopeptide repeat protein n=1 Tax=Striga asiatica TaxID=4170 RepID=A0A5A7QQ88_STRAF|nr:tetratricopeptide repeat protein [Striga asiatica]
MSVDELKIREELEIDVESNLEGEIKEEIYHLALKLHRLYQHQKQKTLLMNQSSHDHENNARKKMLTEVNINIKLEGGTTIRINEIKKEGRGGGLARIAKGKGLGLGPNRNRRAKFDWAGSLRSKESSEMIVNHGPDRKRDSVRGLVKDKKNGYGNEGNTNKGEWKY